MDIYEFATDLHSYLCKWGHEGDYCTWLFEDWTGFAHKHYLEKANKLIAETDLTAQEILSVIAALGYQKGNV